MTNWENEIITYFRPGHRHTNASTESSNRGMKDRQRDTRSMKFETYRAKILFSQVLKSEYPRCRSARRKPLQLAPKAAPRSLLVPGMTSAA